MKTRKDIDKFMRESGFTGIMIKRMNRLMNGFATLEAFFGATKGDLMAMFGKTSKSSRGLGDKFWPEYDKILAFYKSPDKPDNECLAEKAKEEAPGLSRYARMFSLKELKTVVEFMELCDVEAINLMEVVGFLSTVRIRQKPAVEKPAEVGGHE